MCDDISPEALVAHLKWALQRLRTVELSETDRIHWSEATTYLDACGWSHWSEWTDEWKGK